MGKDRTGSLYLLSKCAELAHMGYLDGNRSVEINSENYQNVSDKCHKEILKTLNNPIDMRVRTMNKQKTIQKLLQRSPPPSYSESIQRQSIQKSKIANISEGESMCDIEIDEHFRKSLGPLYDTSSGESGEPKKQYLTRNRLKNAINVQKDSLKNSENVRNDNNYLDDFDVRGYTVDDHFSKALGSDTWSKICSVMEEKPPVIHD